MVLSKFWLKIFKTDEIRPKKNVNLQLITECHPFKLQITVDGQPGRGALLNLPRQLAEVGIEICPHDLLWKGIA